MKKSHLLFLDKIKVQNQLYFIFFITVFIPVIIVGSYLLYNTRSLLMNHYREQVRLDDARIKSLLLDLTTNVYKQADSIAGDDKLKDLLSIQNNACEEGEFRIQENDVFTPLLTQNGSVQYISVYTYNDNLPEGKYIHPVTEDIQRESWYKRAVESVATFWSQETYQDDFGNDTVALCLHTRIFLPEIDGFAILNLTVNPNYIKNRVESRELKTVLWLNDTIFYSSKPQMAQIDVQQYVTEKGQEYMGIIQAGKDRAVACISAMNSTQYEDVFFVASINDTAISYINKIIVLYCLILVLIVLESAIFVGVFSRYFSRRVNTLRAAMHKASQGNYEIEDSFQGTDELSDVFADMTEMIRTILGKEESIYKVQLQAQKLTAKQWQMEFKMLSSQINSHFLYNTLETIRMRSLRAGNHEVANAIKMLGKSMRYVLENTITTYTSLEKELDYIEVYLGIQKLRFYDRINYELRVQQGISTEDYPLLPLLLQPIVENAVIHGLEEVEENGKIIIHISARDSLLLIDIFDNGCGMSPEQQNAVYQKIYDRQENNSKSIGLHNIYQRIQLCYGKEYGFTIRSRENMGTIVRITLPMQISKREENTE